MLGMGQAKGTVRSVNDFTTECLGLESRADYKDSADLNFRFVGGKSGGALEAGPSYTMRFLTPASPDGTAFYNSSVTLDAKVFGKVGNDDRGDLFDFTESKLLSGAGLRFNVEYRRGKNLAAADLAKGIEAQLRQTLMDCRAESARTSSLDQPVGVPQCTGDGLAEWMRAKGRRTDYWSKIVKPLWGYDQEPSWFVGLGGSYGWSTLSFFPLIDSAKTGIATLNAIGGKVESKVHPYSIKGYIGTDLRDSSTPDWLKTSLALSLTYRREFDYPSNVKDQTICDTTPPAAGAPVKSYLVCQKANIGPFYESEGFVGGIALNVQTERRGWLPALGIAFKPSYAFDTKRFGFDMPVYFVTDDKGALTSGVQLSCRSAGQTENGYNIAKENCKAALFLGSRLELFGRP